MGRIPLRGADVAAPPAPAPAPPPRPLAGRLPMATGRGWGYAGGKGCTQRPAPGSRRGCPDAVAKGAAGLVVTGRAGGGNRPCLDTTRVWCPWFPRGVGPSSPPPPPPLVCPRVLWNPDMAARTGSWLGSCPLWTMPTRGGQPPCGGRPWEAPRAFISAVCHIVPCRSKNKRRIAPTSRRGTSVL